MTRLKSGPTAGGGRRSRPSARSWGPHDTTPPADDRPFVYLNAAITADGLLAPATRRFEPFSSPRDHRLLYELRTHADAVLCGAGTLGAAPITMGNGGASFTRLRLARGLSEHPLRVVVSGSGSIDPDAAVFQHRFSPILLLTTRTAPARRLKRLRPLVDAVGCFGTRHIDFHAALRWLRRDWNVRSLLCEGGGELNGALFDAGLVDELYLTWCPLILGGRSAPSLADGVGATAPATATGLALQRSRRVGNELFLVFRTTPPAIAPGGRAARRAPRVAAQKTRAQSTFK